VFQLNLKDAVEALSVEVPDLELVCARLKELHSRIFFLNQSLEKAVNEKVSLYEKLRQLKLLEEEPLGGE